VIAEIEDTLQPAAEAVAEAEALLITAGAGMGVDSGLPDFRGDKGFWRDYPPMEKLGISFVEMANPSWFTRDPELAWGFYGHRLNLYRATAPHHGFEILERWSKDRRHPCFVFTSNVDGQFQEAGFSDERILECHGSLTHLQCSTPCGNEIWSADKIEVMVDKDSFRAVSELPECPRCGSLARPNVLMFNDWHWIPRRTSAQEQRFESWLAEVINAKTVIVELGAGSAVPTVRLTSEHAATRLGAKLVRINPREPQTPHGQIGIPLGALEALEAINDRLLRLK